jgi:hypothetical protein
MVEDDGLGVLRAPVLVENLGAVGGGDEGHGCLLNGREIWGSAAWFAAAEACLGQTFFPDNPHKEVQDVR